jgi:arginine utilization regulatory protein
MMNVCEKDFLEGEDLPVMMKQQIQTHKKKLPARGLSLKTNLEGLEKELIENALKQTGGNIKRAAKLLEVPRQTLQYKLSKYKIRIHEIKAQPLA